MNRGRNIIPLVWLALLILPGRALGSAPPVSTLESGFRRMYDLDFAGAHRIFVDWERQYPADPLGRTANAAAYLFSEFDRMHVLELELFTDDKRFEHRGKPAADPQLRQQFLDELAKADALANASLARSPQDRNATLALVLSNGLRADYLALIEKRNIASLGYIKTARTQAEKLLAEDPQCYDAYLALGVENYLLGSNPAPIRWVLHLGGAQTDRDAGIEKLRIVAERGHYLAPFARLLLAVAALRDKNPASARALLQKLASEYPDNHLYREELARLPAQ